MKQKQLFLYFIICTLSVYSYATYNEANPLFYIHLEPQYPSYVAYCGNSLCLRARADLKPETIVGTATMVSSKVSYIHDHPNVRYRHVSIIGFKNKKPRYGRVVGKYAFCNHSCDPNCLVTPDFFIKTTKPINHNEELTLAYDACIPHLSWQKNWNFACECNKSRCKKLINRYRPDIMHPASYNSR
jgi:hypothetical protein